MSILLKFTVTLLLVYYVACETTKCSGKTCTLCIGESLDCVWCPAPNHPGPRCQRHNAMVPSWCSEKVQDPHSDKNNSTKIIKEEKLNATPGYEVQLTPQEVKISIRPGQTVEFPLKYKPAKDYPLDVYFLMDVSYTMYSTMQLLKNQGKAVYTKLTQFTNNVMMGVGSFVEKAALPYANPLLNIAYSFKHHLNLTARKDSFVDIIDKIVLGSNLDAPEAGLDALLQVMACKEKLGWRKNARKIIVLCTDSTYHSAGDGKIAGAAKLNDMECHLENDTYTLELEQDYPTVNQIRKIAKRENIIIIFNVKENVLNEYKALAKRLDVGAQVIELKEKSSITDTIATVYTEKFDNVQMDVVVPGEEGPNKKILVKLSPDCTMQDKCPVEHNKSTLINVSVTAKSCLDKPKTISIKPTYLAETLSITIETLCKCDCDDDPKPNATECSMGNGSLVCGICSCYENRFGDTCQCEGNSIMHGDDLNKCKADKDDTVVCSGTDRGLCSCGTCKCTQHYSGEFCQYDNRACPKVSKKLCSGNGRCYDGQCNCESGWEGAACQCPIDDTSCRAPYSKEVCSGNGICKCGECNCTRNDSKNEPYFGAFCDSCYDCDSTRCKELEEHVKCIFFNQTERGKCDEKFNPKKTIVVKMANKTVINAAEYHLAKRCTIEMEDGKFIVFKHKYEGKTLHIIIQNEMEEPDRANIWIAIGSSIGVILLIGILTVIIWKILVDVYDAREYKKFNKMLDESGDMENINQIYKEPKAEFKNPLFKRRSRMSHLN